LYWLARARCGSAAYDYSDDAEAQLFAVAVKFLAGSPFDVTPEELTEDFISRV
jgi:hypothetical protein